MKKLKKRDKMCLEKLVKNDIPISQLDAEEITRLRRGGFVEIVVDHVRLDFDCWQEQEHVRITPKGILATVPKKGR